MLNIIAFSRRELYDLVWSDSLLSLSKRYNISDNGLRKACSRMGIPLPDMGYWNKVKAGKKVKAKPFVEKHDGEQKFLLSVRKEGTDQPEAGLSEQVTLQRSIEFDESINLLVPRELINPDPLIEAAQKALLSKPRGVLRMASGHLGITQLK